MNAQLVNEKILKYCLIHLLMIMHVWKTFYLEVPLTMAVEREYD